MGQRGQRVVARLQVCAAVVGQSSAMMADAVHSLSDFLPDDVEQEITDIICSFPRHKRTPQPAHPAHRQQHSHRGTHTHEWQHDPQTGPRNSQRNRGQTEAEVRTVNIYGTAYGTEKVMLVKKSVNDIRYDYAEMRNFAAINHINCLIKYKLL